jgi:hypothetical protein
MGTVKRHVDPLLRLEADGLVEPDGGSYQTTARWKAALARAALRLMRNGESSGDLRLPIASALVELYGPGCPDAELVQLVQVIMPIEEAALRARQS